MRLKSLSRGFLPVLLLLLAACTDENDCGDVGGNSYTNITGLTGSAVHFNNAGYYGFETLKDSSAVMYGNFGLRLLPEVEYYALQKQKMPKGSWFSAAYACSPMPPRPSEKIADITVFSHADYVQGSSSKVLAAGDTLNSVFEIYDYYSGRIVGLPDFLADDDLMASEEGFVLRPAVAVASPQLHQFTVHYRLTNGEFYTYKAAPITLTP